jgi:TolB-like protein/DNA-binding winged helix-turn-helix (wHTH) protein/tetratricopeptide (TPR) repeat protein
MKVDRPARATIRFDAFELDMRAGGLQKAGVRVKLQDQPLQILRILLEHPGEVVTREEIQRQLWPSDTFVDFEHGLYNAIKRVREALGDSAENPRFIETVPKLGYRFIGLMNGVNRNICGEAPIKTGEVVSRSWRWLGAIAAVAVLAAAVFYLNVFGLRHRIGGGPPAERINSLAVLPLTNLSGDSGQEYFSDGITDALITDLAKIGSIKVISRTSTMQYKGTRKALPEIARELGVDGIVEGTVQRSGNRVRITAQLINGSSDKHLWAETYERDIGDIFAVETEVTRDIARHIEAEITSSMPTTSTRQRIDLAALEAYLQGNYLLNKFGGDAEMRRAQQSFEKAIAADPSYAPAYIGLAYSHYLLLLSTPDDQAARRSAAEKAVGLEPSSSDAHSALGDMKFADWEWAGAEDEFRRAIALSPNNAKAHGSLCEFLNAMGRLQESFTECQVAQQLDPDYDHLSEMMEARGNFAEAAKLLENAIEHHPNDLFLHYFLYRDYALNRSYNRSIEELERAVLLAGYTQIAGDVRRAYTADGYRGALRQYAEDLEHLHTTGTLFVPRLVAEVYAQLGDRERAFYWLDEGFRQRHRIGHFGGLNWILIEHELDPLHEDPRWSALVRRVGLPVQLAEQ